MMFDLINPKEFSKAEIVSSSNKIIEYIENGDIDPIELFIQMKRISEIMSLAMKSEKVTSDLIDAVERHAKTDREFYGVDLQIRNGIAKWDFSSDPEWSEIQDQIDNLTKKKRLIEKSLKANHEAHRSSITEDGEISDTSNIKCIPAKQIVAIRFK